MGQNTNINLGRKGKFGTVNLDAFKGGVKKIDLKSAEQIKLFDKFDADKNGILTQDEIQSLVNSLGAYTEDGKITKREAKKFVKQNGLKGEVDKKQVFEMLKNLGIASDNIAETTVDDENINIRYNQADDGSTLTETLKKSDGSLTSKTTVKDGRTVTQYFDETGKVKKESTEENGVTTIVEYDESGNVTSTIRKKGTVTEYIEDGKVTKKETDQGSGLKETVEYEYDNEGNVSKSTTTKADGTIVVEDGETITTINTDGTKSVQNKESGEIQEYDAHGNLIEPEPEQVSTQDALKNLFGENRKASVTIDGTETGLSNKAYQGEIRLVKGENLEDGQFPQTLRMSLPKSYGDNAAMTLTLIDAENGIYESSAHDRNFQITTDENGNVTVKSVNVEELSGKLNANLETYRRLEEERRAEQDAKINEEQGEVRTGNTLTNENVIYQKDSKGNVTYINKETGEPLSAEEVKQLIQAESTFISDKLYDAAKGIGTKNKQFKEGIGHIYSSEILQNVNEQLKAKGYKELKEGGIVTGMPIENLILDEQSRSDALASFRTLIDNGVMTTQESARTIKRELEYEVHGGFGITRTSKVDEIMMLVPNRETRVELENQFVQDAKHKGLEPNEGSIVRAYLAADGWKADAVDRFDANWVKNNSYSHEQDQEHRNGVIGRLVFEHGTGHNNENLKAGLGAVDTDSADYTYLTQRAVQANEAAGYKKQFAEQDSVQQYIAGRTSDNGVIDAGEVSACNTLMYKGIKPINIQAEEALYDAKNGDLSHVFDSMDPKLYAEINTMLANGEIKGCKSLQDVYKQAMEKTTDVGEKARLQANAILSGQVEFSDDEITDFCVNLMHRIDTDRGNGSSSHVSAGYTNDADYETVQLKAILQANPQIIENLKAKVQEGEFKYTVTIDNGENAAPSFINHDTKADYLAILADTKTVAQEAVFLDENGNKITDPETVKALQEANMKSLDAMREYVAQLEREYKLGIDAEGGLSRAANALSRYSGLGTDRGDVETKYREAKVLLDQLEAAAQGRLRDADGNVISAQDLAQQLIDKENELMQTNNDYKTTIQTGKMAIVMAPVIVATTVVTGGLSAVAGTAVSGTTMAAVAGGTTGAVTYGMNAIEYNTSYTGNTAAARENNLNESLINGGSVFIGAAQMKYISGMLNNASSFVRGGGRLTTVLASDIGVGAAGEYVQTGQVSVNGVAMNAVFSATGNLIGLKSLAKKQQPVPNIPKVGTEGVLPNHRGEVNNHRDFVADGEVARRIDQRSLNENQRRMVAEALEDIPTEADIAAFRRQLGEAPTSEQRAAIEANNAHTAEANARAHQIGENISDDVAARLRGEAGNTTAASSAPAASPQITALENDIKGLDGNIRRLENQIKGAKKFGKNTEALETQLEVMKQRRATKAAELDALQKPVAEAKPEAAADIEVLHVETPVTSEPIAMTRENAGTFDLNSLKSDLDANGIQYKDSSRNFVKGNHSISFTRDGIEYALVYDKNGRCTWSESHGNGTSVLTDFKNGKPVTERVRTYSGPGNASIELKRTEFNADGSKTVYDFGNNKKISYDADGKLVSETVLKADTPEAPKVEHEPTPEEIARQKAENERLRVELGEPSSLSDEELLSELNRLSGKVRRYWKNGIELETAHTIRKREINAELKKRGLEVRDGKLVKMQQGGGSFELNENELVRFAGNNGKSINPNYIKTSKELRSYFNNAIETGEYAGSYQQYVETIQNGHKIAYAGKDGKNLWYGQVGQGHIDINPGIIRGEGILRSNRVEEGTIIEKIAKQYGDSYRINGSSKIKLSGISSEALPSNIETMHFYPDGKYMDQYFQQMYRTSNEAINLIQNGASQTEILSKLAEHYQYSANARPFGQINNSLFMNEINTLLKKAGMKTMPHGMLDHAAQRLQPDAFKKYFIDEYYKTALS